jgi:deoxyadenosine/deoxycytidine kinase
MKYLSDALKGRPYLEITGLSGSGKTTLVELLASERFSETTVRGFPTTSKTFTTFLSCIMFPIRLILIVLGYSSSRRQEVLSILTYMISRKGRESGRVIIDQGFLHSWVSLSRSIYCSNRTAYAFLESTLLAILRRGLKRYRGIIFLTAPVDELIMRVSKRAKRHSTDTMDRQEVLGFYESFSLFFDLMIGVAKDLNIPVTVLDTRLLNPDEIAMRVAVL